MIVEGLSHPAGQGVIDLALGAYAQDFESGPGGFTAEGTSGGWELGVPSLPSSIASNGTTVWVTDLDGPGQNGVDYPGMKPREAGLPEKPTQVVL